MVKRKQNLTTEQKVGIQYVPGLSSQKEKKNVFSILQKIDIGITFFA